MPKPVIAAVNGMAAGAGAGLAFACDFRLASNKAGFLIAFANVGLTLDSGVSWTLPRLVGGARATALCLLAEPINAEAALEMGLVNAVVEPDRLLPAAQELAARLAAGPTAAYAAISESLAFAATSTLDAGARAKRANCRPRWARPRTTATPRPRSSPSRSRCSPGTDRCGCDYRRRARQQVATWSSTMPVACMSA